MKIDCAYDKLVPVDKLVPHRDNPNKHPKRQIELLAKIINYQGFRHPIVVSNRSGFICAGHGRLEAAKALGYTEVPVDYQDFEDEAAEYAFLVSDNTIAELADHDNQLIVEKILADFPELDTELLGFDDFNLASVKEINSGDENSEWADMPEFKPGEIGIRLTIIFENEKDREEFVKSHEFEVTKKQLNHWIHNY